MKAQRQAEVLLNNWRELERLARAIANRSQEVGKARLWPVGAAAERLAGAVAVVGRGDVELMGWTHGATGLGVLLLGVSEVTPIGMVQAAQHARGLGATEVHAVGIAVNGLDAEAHRHFDSYSELAIAVGSSMLQVA